MRGKDVNEVFKEHAAEEKVSIQIIKVVIENIFDILSYMKHLEKLKQFILRSQNYGALEPANTFIAFKVLENAEIY